MPSCVPSRSNRSARRTALPSSSRASRTCKVSWRWHATTTTSRASAWRRRSPHGSASARRSTPTSTSATSSTSAAPPQGRSTRHRSWRAWSASCRTSNPSRPEGARMPAFDDSTTTTAPVEEVWKLLYDPSRIVEWWDGIERAEPRGTDGKGDMTIWPDGYPDFPMPQNLPAGADGRSVTISCLVSDLVFEWKLEPLDDGTRISVHVEIPEEEAFRLDDQRAAVSASLRSLAAL